MTIDEQHLADIQTVANNLQFLGMTVDNILSVSGIITGSARRSLIPSLKAVPGVKSKKSHVQPYFLESFTRSRPNLKSFLNETPYYLLSRFSV